MKWMRGVFGAVCLVGVAAGAATAQDRSGPADSQVPAYTAMDPVSGVDVRIFRAKPPAARFDVSDGRVLVSKSVAPGRSETVVTFEGERLEIRLSSEGLMLDGTAGPLTVAPGDAEAARQARNRLAASAAVRESLRVLARVSRQTTSPISYAVATTRVMLSTLAGDGVSARAVARSIYNAPGGRIVRVVQDGPGECWDTYVEEAIEAYMEYEECVDSRNWWDVPGIAACFAIYDIRAIGAFSWWLSCVAIRS
jgi:hypothetical protein